MKVKKHIFSRFIILVVLAVTILIIYGIHSKRPSFDFTELIKNENIDDISLTIYHVNPFIFTSYPWGVDDLIRVSQNNKIEVNGSELESSFDLIKQVSSTDLIPVKKLVSITDLIPVKKQSDMNARVYYEVKSKKNGELFDVAMWGGYGDKNSIFVNGFEVKGVDIFYDIIVPFLPADEVKDFEKWRN